MQCVSFQTKSVLVFWNCLKCVEWGCEIGCDIGYVLCVSVSVSQCVVGVAVFVVVQSEVSF